MGGDGEALADLVDAFVGGGFEADGVGWDTQGGGEGGFHRGEVGRDFRALGDKGGVDVADGPAAGGEIGGDVGEEFLGIDAAVGGVGIRKMVTDVGQAGGAEEGVADGVGEGVGIGVAVEADGAVGEGHAAEDQGAAGDEAVDVVAVADAIVHAELKS